MTLYNATYAGNLYWSLHPFDVENYIENKYRIIRLGWLDIYIDSLFGPGTSFKGTWEDGLNWLLEGEENNA